MQQVRRAPLTVKGVVANLLFDAFDAFETLGMKRDDEVFPQITVEFFGREIRRISQFRLDAVNDKVPPAQTGLLLTTLALLAPITTFTEAVALQPWCITTTL